MRGRETSMCGCLSHIPYWGPGPQPRHLPWLGIELATLWFTGRHLIHWVTPAKANFVLFFRERVRVGERRGEKHRYVRETGIGCLLHAPNWGPGPQPGHVPWLGMELVTLWFTGQHSIHWATGNYTLRTWNTNSKEPMHPNVNSSIIYNSQVLEAT